jgi:hypothetical protein
MDRPALNSRVVSLASLPPCDDPPLGIAPKLIVVVSGIAEEAALARRILVLASARDLPLLLLGVCAESDGELELRRKLVILAAFTRDQGLSVEIRVESGKDWVRKVAAVWNEGDLLACYAGENSGTQRNSLSDLLSSNLGIPVYLFTGLDTSRPDRNGIFSQIVSWIGSVAIILGFLWFQMKVTPPGTNGAYPVWLILSVLVEIGMIWLWNSLSA